MLTAEVNKLHSRTLKVNLYNTSFALFAVMRTMSESRDPDCLCMSASIKKYEGQGEEEDSPHKSVAVADDDDRL